MLITKNNRLLQIIAFYDFVSVVSRQCLSFVKKMEVVTRITSSRLVITSSPRIWDRINLVITVNTSSRSHGTQQPLNPVQSLGQAKIIRNNKRT